MLNSIEGFIRAVESQTGDPVQAAFLERAQRGAPTRDENPQTHFCVYFAAYDPAARKVFIGHHRKSGFWLFNGGHIDRGETPADAVVREIDEEWGLKNVAVDVHHPQLMTITEIDNPLKQTCTRHYDFWYFLPFDHTQVRFDADKLGKEFQVSAWLTIPEAIERSTDPATLQALAYIDEQLLRL